MNFELPYIPERITKPRQKGLTMMMDKGLSCRETEDFISASGHLTDVAKFGFGTAFVTNDLQKKIDLYKEAGIKPYFGGTNHTEKCELIHRFSKERIVMSEVGSKDSGIIVSPSKWVKMMSTELEAGSWKVIAEGREAGNVGVFRPNGTAHTYLINKIISKVDPGDILWEAPQKNQQVWFIKLFGANVNLGNIGPNEVIPLECLRLGLRGDTFFEFLPSDYSDRLKQVNDEIEEEEEA